MTYSAHKNRFDESGAMYFGPREGAPPPSNLKDALNELIDAALKAENRKQEPRDYLGGSIIGQECHRKLAYMYFAGKTERARFEADPENFVARDKFDGRPLRRFRVGHWCEDEVAALLRMAGFDLKTHTPDGRQFSWGTARDPETGKNRMGGNIDGKIDGGPLVLPYPLLWENKMMNNKKWTETFTKGVKAVYPTYYGQVQTYMAYLDFRNTLFTAYNADTSDIHSEIIPFNQLDAQHYTDRAVAVLRARSPEELPRMTNDPAHWLCKWCDFSGRCWNQQPEQPSAPVPHWLAKGADK